MSVKSACASLLTTYSKSTSSTARELWVSRKIRVGEVVIIHDDHTKPLIWTVGVVKELITSTDGLIRSVMVKMPNVNLINCAIQSLHFLELREDQPEDVEFTKHMAACRFLS